MHFGELRKSVWCADEEENIADQLGLGSGTADADLEDLQKAAEAQIVVLQGLIGRYAPLLLGICTDRCERVDSRQAPPP